MVSTTFSDPKLEFLELDLLMEAVQRQYGRDLRTYARPLLLHQFRSWARDRGLPSLSALQGAMLRNPDELESALETLSGEAAPLFDEPEFYLALRREVVPFLKTHPSVRVWHVGCGSGEDTHALAMVLREEGLAKGLRIYATDGSARFLESARAGRYALTEEAHQNYERSGGKGSLSDWFCADEEGEVVNSELRASIFFAHHHLESDGAFNEFQLIVCRNVLLQFSRGAYDRIHNHLYDSVSRFGFLCLGERESVRGTPHASCYEEVDAAPRFYRRIA